MLLPFYQSGANYQQGILEIGRRLIEAKAMLSHGEWMDWLQNTVEFSVHTAGRFMQIARVALVQLYFRCDELHGALPRRQRPAVHRGRRGRLPPSAALQNLPYTKLISLLQVPEEAFPSNYQPVGNLPLIASSGTWRREISLV